MSTSTYYVSMRLPVPTVAPVAVKLFPQVVIDTKMRTTAGYNPQTPLTTRQFWS